MTTLADAARRMNRPDRARGMPRLILMTDTRRLPDPVLVIPCLPAGAAVILRHYDDPERAGLALRLARACREHHVRLLIAGDARLARTVRADGLHLPEAMLRGGPGTWRLLRRPRWLITVAAHDEAAVAAAAKAGVSAVLLSPVFATASHPKAPALGPIRFARLARRSPIPVYALGGIDAAQARRLAASGAAGFAAIGGLAGGVAQASSAARSARS